ncbi:MAG: DUF4434 domain-containing protein [Armatimonadota bacterium]
MISRRRFLAGCAAAVCGAGTTHPSLRCRPVISGPLWWYDPLESKAWGESGWRDELDQHRKIGFNLLWLCNCPAGLASPEDATNLHSLMDLCARRKVRVILDTGCSPGWYGKLDLQEEIELCSANIRRIGQEFAEHPAFFAWYVPHEIYVWHGEGAAYIDKLYPALVERCKNAAAKPVTVSPFFILDRDKVFGDFRYAEPGEYERYWARLIRLSGFDIVMLQDSGEHFSYVTNKMRRPFFEAMSAACRTAGARFWGNVETAEYDCPSKEEFVRRYGRIHHAQAKGLRWRPVPIERLKEKLDLASEYSEEIVTWGYREFCRPALGDDARKWYEEYRRLLR